MSSALVTFVAELATSLAEDPPGGAALLAISSCRPAFTVVLHPLAGHPLAALVGFAAPPEWSALGLVAEGTARSLDHHPPPGGRRVATALFVTRSGDVVSRTRSANGSLALDEPPSGVVVDALLRAFRLPTPPPPARDVETWIEVHAGASAGALRHLGIDPVDAAWFDVGSFSRHLCDPRQGWLP